MAFYRGQTGYISLGGQLQGAPFVNGALLAGATSISIDGNGSTLIGSVAVGDQFTIAGESGSPVHTVTGTFYIATSSAIAGITFTNPIAAGGAADNAAITFVSNAVAQVTQWSLSATEDELETTVMGDSWKSYVGGLASWSGQAKVRFDYSDLRQKALVDKVLVGTPVQQISALTLGVAKDASPQIRQFYGAAVLKDLAIASTLGSIVEMTFGFTGNGALLPNWVIS